MKCDILSAWSKIWLRIGNRDGVKKRMRLQYSLILLIFLAGCDAPGRHFRGIEPVRVSMGKSVFEIRQRGNLAEALRINKRHAPRLGRVADEAKAAIEQATGCQVTRILGDAVMITAKLRC